MYFIIKLLHNSHKFKNIQNSRKTHTMPISMTFFSFSFKATLFCCLFFLLFSLLHFHLIICFCNSVFCKYLRNIGRFYIWSNWENRVYCGIFDWEFLTVVKTLNIFCKCYDFITFLHMLDQNF